jgi:sugar phosphate permease
MTLLTTVVVLAMVATLAVLMTGVGSMAHGGVFDRKHSTQFMAARVVVQGVAVVLMLIAVYLTLSS